MLGSNIGKKVTAFVVQDEYKQFLKNKPDEKKNVLTPEERKLAKRAEMRKRGIFVKADDPDETPTILEKIEGPCQPMVYVLPEKRTIWKNTRRRTTRRRRTESRKNVQKAPKSEPSASSGTRKDKEKKVKKSDVIEESSHNSKKRLSGEKSKKEAGNASNVVEADKPKRSSGEAVVSPVVEKKAEVCAEPNVIVKAEDKTAQTPGRSADQKPEDRKLAEVESKVVTPEVKKVEDSPPDRIPAPATALPSKPVPEVKSPPKQLNPAAIIPALFQSTSPSPTVEIEAEDKTRRDNVSLTASNSTSSMTESVRVMCAPLVENQRDAFDKLDDDEFEKMTSDADEKEILKLTPRLLKVAKKHAAIEKCLTPEENDVLAKFFSGKQKLDASVLAILDSALDKIIDYLQKNNCAVDEETKKVMKKRDKLKAAMMKEFLVSPQYLPKTWTAKFNEWKTEAEKQKNGINWFRILFSYPKHKSIDDGPEDNFGNFQRRSRSFLIGILLGPGDVKSFEETKREEDCQGMFLDTKIMENATKEKEGSSLNSERTILIDVKGKMN